jgi:hypothetical protein
MTSKLASGIGLLGLVSLGCGARTMIGEVTDGSPSSLIGAGGSGMCTPPVNPNDHPFTSPTAVTGTWTGYFQGTGLAVGADAIKVTIDEAADGTHQIHAVFGSDPPPAPATEASDPYPTAFSRLLLGPIDRGYLDGFVYPAHAVQWFDQRLKFMIAGFQAWESWCLLQQSFALTSMDPVRYSCVPGGGAGSTRTAANGELECFATLDTYGTIMARVDCDQMAMCGIGSTPCQCDRCGCSADINSGKLFDITFDGDVATGTGIGFPLRLTRTAS